VYSERQALETTGPVIGGIFKRYKDDKDHNERHLIISIKMKLGWTRLSKISGIRLSWLCSLRPA